MVARPDEAAWYEPRHDHGDAHRRAAGWRLAAFLLAVLGWVVPAALVWFVALVGIAGWGSTAGGARGLLDEPTSASAAAAVLVAIAAMVVATALLVTLARWTWPHRRREATVLAVVAAAWVPAVATAATVARGIGG